MLRVSLAGFALMASVASAWPHVVVQANGTKPNSYYKLVLAIGHGCDGSPTLRVRVRMPEGVLSVKPQPKAGWEIETRKETLATPAKGPHGNTVTEIVTEVTWSGKLADEHFDEFVVQILTPNKPGTTIYFPTVQECEKGVHRWVEIPRSGQRPSDLKEPAPWVHLEAPRPLH